VKEFKVFGINKMKTLEEKRIYDRLYRLKNKEKLALKYKRYDSSDKRKASRKTYNQRRYKQLKVATPNWANTDMIQAFYDMTPDNMVVDHIIPLCSDSVCGLHVHYNLQYLTRQENKEKGNRI
jgi:5-methylcytosine-specific restriction endonuclease McrA